MPARNLTVPYQAFLERNKKHGEIVAALSGLDPALQKALAELVMLRLFDDLQEALAGIAYRLACGAPYIDGATPTLLTGAAKSSAGARHLFESHGRPKRRYVKWSLAKYVKDTTKYVIDQGDPFLRACDAHSLSISEMQAVRNRIAHRNASTRSSFSVVVRRYYGGAPSSVTPGLLLLSSRVSPSPLEAYLTATRVIVRESAKG